VSVNLKFEYKFTPRDKRLKSYVSFNSIAQTGPNQAKQSLLSH